MLASILIQILALFKLALFARIIIDYIRMFARNWRPNAFLLEIFEFIYSIVVLIAINLAQGAVSVLL